MSTVPGDSSWADAGLVPPDNSVVPDPERSTVPVPPPDQPRAPRPDLRDEADEGDILEQAEPVPDDESEEYPTV